MKNPANYVDASGVIERTSIANSLHASKRLVSCQLVYNSGQRKRAASRRLLPRVFRYREGRNSLGIVRIDPCP